MSGVDDTPLAPRTGGERLRAFAAWLLAGVSGLYAAFLVGAAAVLWLAGDQWWPATVLLFGPRWTLGLPFLVLVPFTAWLAPRALFVLGVGFLAFVFPLLGLQVSPPRSARDGDIRIYSANVAAGRFLERPLKEAIAEWDADIVALQECPRSVDFDDPSLDYEFRRHGGLCLLSRFPITGSTDIVRHLGQAQPVRGYVARYALEITPGDTIAFTNLHLPTPRDGLEEIRRGDLWEGVETLRRDTEDRAAAARTAREFVDVWLEGQVVVGDFNAPPESRIQRRVWGHLRNAFASAGNGFGFTRYNGWIRARIDHVLVDGGWTVVQAHVGDNVGSDHRPLSVTLRRR